MKLKQLLTISALLAVILPSAAYAQSALEKEGGGFYLCQDMIGTDGEARACVEWLVTATCQSTYQLRTKDFERYLSSEKIHTYRVDAEKKLPANCEPMSAIILNYDILKNLQDQEERTKRVVRIVKWADKLSPGQKQRVAGDIIYLSDITELMKNKDIRNYILKCRDEATAIDGVVPEPTAAFLRQLENFDSTLITPNAQALLLNHEIKNGQYRSAASRLDHLNFKDLNAKTKKETIELITASGRALFGDSMFPKSMCYPEFRQSMSADPVLALFKMLYENKPDAFVAGHLTSRYLTACDMNAAASTVFSAFKQFPDSYEATRNLDNLTAYVDKQRSTQLLSAIIAESSKLSGASADYFKMKVAPKLIQFILDTARQSLERGDAAAADALLTPMLNIGTARFEVLLDLGRAKQMAKNSAAARQYWAEIIEKAGRSPLTEKAYFLSILSFRQDAKTAEADALRERFEQEYPMSEWIAFL